MLDLLWAIAGLFIVMWILGFAFHFTMGGLIHVLLLLAVASILVRVVFGHRGRRTT